MTKQGLLDRLLSAIGLKEKKTRYWHFVDYQGNFEIDYPSHWHFDPEIAYVEGKYSVSFESGKSGTRFVVSVDCSIPQGFKFDKYAKSKLSSPESGFIAKIERKVFHGYPAFAFSYVYHSGSDRYLAKGLMFFTGNAVLSFNLSCRECDEKTKEIFSHMQESIVIKRGMSIRTIPPSKTIKELGG